MRSPRQNIRLVSLQPVCFGLGFEIIDNGANLQERK